MSKAGKGRGIGRRNLLAGLALGTLAGVGGLAVAYKPLRKWWRLECQDMPVREGLGYGPLRRDPAGMLDLPEGFSYRILCRKGEPMNDGFTVPGAADGAAVFAMPDGGYRIIRNHEIAVSDVRRGRYEEPQPPAAEYLYDPACRGGTITLVLDRELRLRRKFLSLTGTERNCAGGATAWGSWISCEESAHTPASEEVYTKPHGYNFEVPAKQEGLAIPKPLKAMGRFTHEAVAFDPVTGAAYQTEDKGDSCLYKFLPERQGDLSRGRLLALRIDGRPGVDTSNGVGTEGGLIPVGKALPVSWVPLREPDPAQDDLRHTARALGAATFSRGEGIVWAQGGAAFTCTDGGASGLGQIWHYKPTGPETGLLTLLAEAEQKCRFFMPDNIAALPNGDLVMAEDNHKYTRLIGLTPGRETYPFAYYQYDTREELSGIAFSPDGSFMVVSAYGIGITFLVTGPFIGSG
ncbi:MAG: DUF839 domain-containing protein [SAR324 cluster bacterium]|nr:DUF839 domain-containing protein [SAR324 cluster bacterium]MCZ6645919.1 DUF839 domain-containing protein [SAR324 cluster bacterium]